MRHTKFEIYRRWRDLPEPIAVGVETLLQEAFPPEERRELEELHRLLDRTPLELLTAEESGQTCGFIMVWNLEEMVFLENFAVDPELRGKGLGSRMLDFVAEHWSKPVLLEVELPEGETERRRIGFYERNGFCLSQYPYRMPCLHGDGPPVPLLLMSRPVPLTDNQARAAAECLYDYVYAGKRRPDLP